jgi:D-glycero-D-manno-heptose 1,7-bisphosphate phosphatase
MLAACPRPGKRAPSPRRGEAGEAKDGMAGQRALFLDRDGVINVDTGFLHRSADCVFVDGIFELASTFAAHGFRLVVVTNQSGIGRGYYSEADFTAFMRWMRGEFARQGVEIDAVYHCPDHPTEGIGRYRRENPWRKPGPGMLLQAAQDLELDLAASWAIGDKTSDVEAARAAGIGTILLLDPTARETRHEGDHRVVPSLAAATALLRGAEPG